MFCASHTEIEDPLLQCIWLPLPHGRLTAEPGGWHSPFLGSMWIQVEGTKSPSPLSLSLDPTNPIPASAAAQWFSSPVIPNALHLGPNVLTLSRAHHKASRARNVNQVSWVVEFHFGLWEERALKRHWKLFLIQTPYGLQLTGASGWWGRMFQWAGNGRQEESVTFRTSVP